MLIPKGTIVVHSFYWLSQFWYLHDLWQMLNAFNLFWAHFHCEKWKVLDHMGRNTPFSLKLTIQTNCKWNELQTIVRFIWSMANINAIDKPSSPSERKEIFINGAFPPFDSWTTSNDIYSGVNLAIRLTAPFQERNQEGEISSLLRSWKGMKLKPGGRACSGLN